TGFDDAEDGAGAGGGTGGKADGAIAALDLGDHVLEGIGERRADPSVGGDLLVTAARRIGLRQRRQVGLQDGGCAIYGDVDGAAMSVGIAAQGGELGFIFHSAYSNDWGTIAKAAMPFQPDAPAL